MIDTVYLITTLAADGADTAEIAPNAIGGSQYLSLLVGVFLPIVVAFVTKRSMSSTVKSTLLLALSGVSGVLTELLNDANFQWEQALVGAVMTFVVGVATLFGLWMPTGVDAAAKDSLVKD